MIAFINFSLRGDNESGAVALEWASRANRMNSGNIYSELIMMAGRTLDQGKEWFEDRIEFHRGRGCNELVVFYQFRYTTFLLNIDRGCNDYLEGIKLGINLVESSLKINDKFSSLHGNLGALKYNLQNNDFAK